MSFSSDIKRFNDKVDRAASAIFRGTALDLASKVIRRTPVGNPGDWKSPNSAPEGYAGGALRGSWIVKINTVPTGIPGIKDKSGAKTIAAAAATTARARIGDTVFLVNNLPYAQAVEEGHSQRQAPQGMVEVTVAEFKSVVSARARKHKV